MRKHFAIIALVGFLLYLPSLFGGFIWDDEDFVYANQYVADFRLDKFFTDSQTAGRGKLSNYYRPIPQIIYASVHSLFGFNPFWYHLINIFVHICATSAIFYFFTLLLNQENGVGNFSQSEGKLFGHMVPNKAAEDEKKLPSQFLTLSPLLISLFFLVHPVQTEAVSYISGLSDPLFVLFGFLSLIYFMQDRLLPSLFFFLLSLFSKESAVVFLGLLFLLNYKRIVPFFLITISYLWYHLAFLSKLDMHASWGNNLYANSVTVRLLTFVQNLYSYVGLLLLPKDLFMERDYSITIQTNILNPYLFVFIIFITFIAFVLHRLPANRFPLTALWFCFLAFFVSFLPYTGLILINGIFYEHFLYLPLVFFFAFIILSVVERSRSRLLLFLLLPLLLLFSLRNIARQWDWANPVKFYSQTLSHAPGSIRIRNGLAMAYADKGDLDLAIREYMSAINDNPNVPNLYHNLANAYLAKGDIKPAEENYLKAITVDPKFFFSYQSLASLYQQTNQSEKLKKLIERFNQRNLK